MSCLENAGAVHQYLDGLQGVDKSSAARPRFVCACPSAAHTTSIYVCEAKTGLGVLCPMAVASLCRPPVASVSRDDGHRGIRQSIDTFAASSHASIAICRGCTRLPLRPRQAAPCADVALSEPPATLVEAQSLKTPTGHGVVVSWRLPLVQCVDHRNRGRPSPYLADLTGDHARWRLRQEASTRSPSICQRESFFVTRLGPRDRLPAALHNAADAAAVMRCSAAAGGSSAGTFWMGSSVRTLPQAVVASPRPVSRVVQ